MISVRRMKRKGKVKLERKWRSIKTNENRMEEERRDRNLVWMDRWVDA